MSPENIEVVRTAFEAWNAGDMQRFCGLLDPEVIMRAPNGWPEPGPFVGRQAVVRECEEFRGAWDTDALAPISDFIDAGDHVAVRYTWRGVGQGPTATMELTVVLTVHAQKLVSIDYFWDHSRSLGSPRSRRAAGVGDLAGELDLLARRLMERWASQQSRGSQLRGGWTSRDLTARERAGALGRL